MGFIKNQLKYLLAGFVFWLPVGVLVFIVRYLISVLEDSGNDFLEWFVRDGTVYTGLGTLLWIVVFFLTGLVLNRTRIGDFMSRAPVVGLLFRKGSETITLDKLASLSPCLFLYSPTCLSYGWILSEQAAVLNDETDRLALVNVYYPNVPTMLTGQVYAARKETVMKLGNQSREILDVLLYGLRRPETLRYIPWDDESQEEFKRRAELFGLALDPSDRGPIPVKKKRRGLIAPP
ncbi:MAG: hypothetical protein JSW38_06250 [Dehalococcoidia bacterium]|nr:MAG: hypothetical protein JSV02_09810 [Dehalococcoidia bacterium]UCG84413.1 MAG: hypothetical protein JSW38_06250 [Dehalococcoidia bacterium]